MNKVDWGLIREGDWLARIDGVLTIGSGPWCEAVVLGVPEGKKLTFELFTAAGYSFEPDGDQDFGAFNRLVWRPLSLDIPASIVRADDKIPKCERCHGRGPRAAPLRRGPGSSTRAIPIEEQEPLEGHLAESASGMAEERELSGNLCLAS